MGNAQVTRDVLAAIPHKATREWLEQMVELTTPAQVRLVSQADRDELIEICVQTEGLIRLPDGNYYARSHRKDTARAVARTFVASNDPKDKGLFNNWRPSDEMHGIQQSLFKGSMVGKTMYVVPFYTGPVTSKHRRVGVQITDSPYVVLNLFLLYGTDSPALGALDTTGRVARGAVATGDLDNMGQGTDNDKRYFVDYLDECLVLSYGSNYGGNAILPKKFLSLRQAAYDARLEGGWLAEHMLISGIQDLKTGKTRYIVGAFPSASGKTNLAMIDPPAVLKDRYRIWMVSDDLANLHIGSDGKLRAINPEHGLFGVVPGTSDRSNPAAMRAIGPKKGAFFTNVAYNQKTGELWWEEKTDDYPTHLEGWLDWQGKPILERPKEEQRSEKFPWAHPNSRFTTPLSNLDNWIGHAAKLPEKERPTDWDHPEGVPISAVLWGGRLKTREPLIRHLPDYATGIYDGLVMGVQATAAAEGEVGAFKEDPMAMRPFFSYHEGDYAGHWLEVMEKLGKNAPAFFHVNWFRKGEDGKFLWPGYGENLRAILWALERVEGKGAGTETPAGTIPTADALNLEGLKLAPGALKAILTYEPDVWREEAKRRTQWLAKLGDRVPKKIQEVHRQFVRDAEAYR